MSGPEDFEDLEMHDKFEDELLQAMRPVDMRAEKLAKFIALAEEAEGKRAAQGNGPRLVKLSSGSNVIAMPRRTARWVGGAVAAMLVAGVLGGEALHVHREHEAEQTQQQFEAAMRVTDHALGKAHEQLERAGVRLGD